jgi:addiction module HigA family antidote
VNQPDRERRAEAPHPGPTLKRDFLDPLGLDAAAFAAHLGMERASLEAMLAGVAPIDVETAIAIARAFELPAERIVQMQARHDFAAARRPAARGETGLLPQAPGELFPLAHLTGRLGRAAASESGDGAYFFCEGSDRREDGDAYAGIHALWRGDRLRVYDPLGSALWAGPVLFDFDGRVLLPYVRGVVWRAWFAAAYEAEFAPSAEHGAYLASAAPPVAAGRGV